MAKPIEKMGADEILNVSKKLFYGGFCLLPFLWVYNVLYIWPVRHRSDLSPQIRHYLLMSGILATLLFIIFSTWFGIFVNHRLSWGATGDLLTVVLVKGA
ncbi:gamma-secretase aspartyl protease complex, presenilin enhancer-2 subunit [Gamsiella multidivaricata]|uniref:gamma-secretase aspartyl protease complex, presenilin enhancer-2 subunit n=1 Tax=Gamsiella multidivaricata TaxID=101098 RepID=UPI00221FA304|nr:gamma-secretase aspartyl protease complex, presenilin enhancer-2 subunit [Gamsiella multidivaricata]KAG0368612.1 Gamma-secretase subunit pen-2 [Gamsiella multidivaricata]KAI7820325.1 gamma-secretase aspartyl protease complex, presenilin enhancer-2 subunit [Gamsiella multidivaricata]